MGSPGCESLGGAEDIFGNLRPISQGSHVRQVAWRFVMAKKDLNDVLGKRGFEKSFFQVVNEVSATGFADVTDFFRPRFAKMNVLRRKPNPMRIEKSLRRQPFARGLLQIKTADDRSAGFVADDVDRQPPPDCMREEFQNTGKWQCPRHMRAIDVTLQFRPIAFLSLLPEEITHVILARGHGGGNQPAFHRDGMKQFVVADNRVVKINAEDHFRNDE